MYPKKNLKHLLRLVMFREHTIPTRCVKDPLVAFGCLLLFGGVVVSTTHFPFPLLILLSMIVHFLD